MTSLAAWDQRGWDKSGIMPLADTSQLASSHKPLRAFTSNTGPTLRICNILKGSLLLWPSLHRLSRAQACISHQPVPTSYQAPATKLLTHWDAQLYNEKSAGTGPVCLNANNSSHLQSNFSHNVYQAQANEKHASTSPACTG